MKQNTADNTWIGSAHTHQDFINYAIDKGVPEHTAQALADWVWFGYQPGSFLSGMLFNGPVRNVLGRADNWNRKAIYDIATFIYCHVPAMALGDEYKPDQLAWNNPLLD